MVLKKESDAEKAPHKALLTSTKLIEAIISSTKHLIISTDENGVVTFFNKASQKALGYTEKEVVGKQTPALWHDIKEVVERAEVLSKELGTKVEPGFDVFVLKARKFGPETGEWTFIRKDKTTFPANLTVTCIRDEFEEIMGYLGVIEDITERKKNEREREKLINQLMSSNEELERFAYICSHDMQEPLRMMSNFSSLLQRHISQKIEGDKKAQHYFKFVIDGADHAQSLIKDILSYASLDRNSNSPEQIDLVEIIRAIEQNQQLIISEHQGGITYEQLPQIMGYKMQIYQVFQNLINNGMKYKKENFPPIIHISFADKGEHWMFSISDNGIGMESHQLEKIFEVFKRLHRKDEYSGTGIGLSICKKVVERHGGKIWVESEVGRGSTFYFTILKPEKFLDSI